MRKNLYKLSISLSMINTNIGKSNPIEIENENGCDPALPRNILSKFGGITFTDPYAIHLGKKLDSKRK